MFVNNVEGEQVFNGSDPEKEGKKILLEARFVA